MDKLYLLIATLSFVFFFAVIAMNTHDLFYSYRPVKEGFEAEITSTVEKIRKCMDALALNTTPDGSSTEEGAELCAIYKDMDPDTAAKNIPGGALPCPLVQYPSAGASDTEWLAWFQNIPPDFGARVVFMVLFADNTITPQKDTINNIITQGFENTAVCTPELLGLKKQIDSASKCVMPADMTTEQITTTVDTIIQQLEETKKKLLKGTVDAELLNNPAALFANMKKRIANVKDAMAYLNEKKEAGEKDLASMILPSKPPSAAAMAEVTSKAAAAAEEKAAAAGAGAAEPANE
jgi:hypothetical protein